MYVKNKKISGIFKLVIALCAALGLALQCGLFTASPDFSAMRYYTLMSNALCMVYFLLDALVMLICGRDLLPRFKGVVVMCITVTGLIFHFMLSDGSFSMGSTQAAANLLLHYAVPGLSVLDWLVMTPRRKYRTGDPLRWVLLPNLYFVYATIRGLVGPQAFAYGRFPYFFIDFDQLGVWKVLLYVIVLNVLFIALGYVVFGLDWLLGLRRPEKKTKEELTEPKPEEEQQEEPAREQN